MEKLNYSVLAALLVLLPGFISILIYNKLIYREKLDTFSKVVEALIYSLFIYFGTALITGTFIIKDITLIQADDKTTIAWSYSKFSIAMALTLSLTLPILIGYLNRGDKFLKLFRKLNLTSRTSQESIWLDIFYEKKKYIIVHMKDGKRLFGWPLFFANKIDCGPLYLAQPAWITEENKYLDLDIDGIFLVDHTNIAHIEFLNEPRENKK